MDGFRLHSRSAECPGATPFVLIHGLVISSLYMIPLAECLADHGEVHALDLPGFGRSQGLWLAPSVADLGDVIIEWLSVNKIRRCHLIANSLGCQISAHVATKAPQMVETLT